MKCRSGILWGELMDRDKEGSILDEKSIHARKVLDAIMDPGFEPNHVHDMVDSCERENPFPHNYIFSRAEMTRALFKRWQYPLLFFLRMRVVRSDGYEFRYKEWNGKIYLLDMKAVREG